MIVNYYRIHFINGEELNVCEGKVNEDCQDLADMYLETLPHGILCIGQEGRPQIFIPVENILYISLIPEEFSE